MARSRFYVCKCGYVTEVIYNDTGEIPETIECRSKDCKNIAVLDFNSNVGAIGHRFRFRDK